MEKLSQLTKLKTKLDSMSSLTKDEVTRLREEEKIEAVYNSNALEGSTITKFETKMILEEGITIAEKPMREHLEVVNLAEAIDYVENLVTEKQPLTERMIKDLHRIVYSRLASDRRNVGEYRRIPVAISGSEYEPPEPYQLEHDMQKLIEWSNQNREKIHPVEYAALLHEKFVTIHPFIDGNGRTARLLLNFALTQAGYPAVIIKANPTSRMTYNRVLETAQVNGDTCPFILFVADIVEEKLKKMISVLEYTNNEN